MKLVEQVKKNGISVRTNFNDVEGQQQAIGQLWGQWFSKRDQSANSYCLYHEYGQDGEYSVTIGTADEDIPQVPEGKFETFKLEVEAENLQKLTALVGEIWAEINSSELNREYSCDVERYSRIGDKLEVTIFVAIK